MPLFKKERSPFWWYDFRFGGVRYRASTQERNKQAAAQVEAAALTRLSSDNPNPFGSGIRIRPAQTPNLREFSARFLEWVATNRNIKHPTRQHYLYGWRLLDFTRLASMPLHQITTEAIECTAFRRPVDPVSRKGPQVSCSEAYVATALSTLKRMLGLAVKWGLLGIRPTFSIPSVPGRECLIDAVAEAKLEQWLIGPDPTRDVRESQTRLRIWVIVVCMMDSGMRPSEVFAIRTEDVHWESRRIWVPRGKSKAARRFVGMTERMHYLLSTWCRGGDAPGWMFPSSGSKSGHVAGVAAGFNAARKYAGLDPRIALYSARHTYATQALRATGNVFAVMKQMGHSSIQAMAPYQHQDIDQLVDAMNTRNTSRIQPQLATVYSGPTLGPTNQYVN